MTGAGLWLPGRFPTLTDLLQLREKDARRRERDHAWGAVARGRDLYTAEMERTKLVIRAACLREKPTPIRGPHHVGFCWVDDARRVDLGNRAGGGEKVILDGLQAAGVFPGDDWRYVRAESHANFHRGEWVVFLRALGLDPPAWEPGVLVCWQPHEIAIPTWATVVIGRPRLASAYAGGGAL